MMSKKSVIIVAGGSGKRFKSNIPKQFLELDEKPVLMHTIEKFRNFDANIEIILVLPASQIDYWKKLCEKYDFSISHKIIEGGEERFFSVKNGLNAIKNSQYIAVHDGVRPLVSQDTIKRGFEIAEKYGTAVPAVNVASSVRIIEEDKNYHIDRKKLRIVQTPQIFSYEILKKSYEQKYSPIFTDDASVVEKAGYKIELFEGNIENIKITTKFDFAFAEFLLSQK